MGISWIQPNIWLIQHANKSTSSCDSEQYLHKINSCPWKTITTSNVNSSTSGGQSKGNSGRGGREKGPGIFEWAAEYGSNSEMFVEGDWRAICEGRLIFWDKTFRMH